LDAERKAAIMVISQSHSPLCLRRFCLRKIGSFAAAAADFGRLIVLGQQSRSTPVRAFNSRAYCYASLGEFDRAVADYTEAIQVRDSCGWGLRGGAVRVQSQGL